MGGIKNEMLEAEERGWWAPDTVVCADCVEDPFLKDLIQTQADHTQCDYCARQEPTPIAVDAATVIEAVYRTVGAYYAEPAASGVPYEGEYLVAPVGIVDVLHRLGFDGHPDFVEDVINAESNGDAFVPAADGHWASSHPHERLSWAWQSFSHTVKHETRFHFARPTNPAPMIGDDIPVYQTLEAVTDSLRSLVRTLPPGTLVYRARVRPRGMKWQPDAQQMGVPPAALTSAGRMNPAGIPYLYTSFDALTARHEIRVAPRSSHKVFSATFELTKPLIVVDLTAIPPRPSIFDVDQKQEREHALFIRQFISAISEKIDRNGREHIAYVPTQVVSEYLAQVFEVEPGIRLGGLIFPSAAHAGGKNLVVFPEDRYLGTYHGVTFRSAK